MTFLSTYGDTEGPLGVPMKDADARALDALLKAHPGAAYGRALVEKATTEIMPGERADVSWITTQAVDRDREVVLATGLDDTHFRNNPIVTLGHCYQQPPVGRSLWRRRVKDGSTHGIKAKTVYPPRPEHWHADAWHPDSAFALIQAGLLNGKSIGFLALEASAPTEEEVRKKPDWANVRRIIRRWLLLEYACTWLPCNQEAIVEAVGKGMPLSADFARALGLPWPVSQPVIPFTPLAEIVKALKRHLGELDVPRLVRDAVDLGVARATGRV
jgi:hypothetical protein